MLFHLGEGGRKSTIHQQPWSQFGEDCYRNADWYSYFEQPKKNVYGAAWHVNVVRCIFIQGGEEGPVEVFQVDDDLSMSHGETTVDEKYNPTLTFPSPTLAVLSNGQGNVALFDTSSRELQLPWKVSIGAVPAYPEPNQ